MGNMYYGDGTNKRLLSGIAQVPRLTLAQYQALTVKPRFWVRTDAPETYNQLVTWDDQAQLGSKNIIKYPYAYGGGTTHGITVAVNNDGSVTASGQPTQSIGWIMITNIITEYGLQVGDKLIFSEHEVNNNNASAALTYVNPASLLSLVQGDYELTVTSEMVTKGVSFILWFNNGVNLSTPVTFKPMVRLTSCSDSTWVSPALTNRKLTELVTYLNETKVKQLEAEIEAVDLTGGGTVNGALYINPSSGKGILRIYDHDSSKYAMITPTSLASNRTYTLPDKTGTVALLSDVFKKEVIDGANVARTITFSGKTWTRRVVLILILAGQSGVGAPISISFGGFTGYNDIGNVFTSDPSITTSGSSITVPNFGGEWGLHTIIKLYDDELTWTVT